MSAGENNAKNEPRPTGIGPGDRLQAARIQQGMSLDDVADRMHLSPAILEAIEENNFEEITAPIFVKGYLRAYARIVALDEDEMIQQYIDFYSEEDPPISSTSNMAPELSANDARIKWTTYLVIVVLAALLTAWWWNKEQNGETPISLDTQGRGAEQAGQPAAEDGSSQIEAVSQSAVDSAESGAPVARQQEPDEPAVIEPLETPASAEAVRAQQPEAPAQQPETPALQPETPALQQADAGGGAPFATTSVQPQVLRDPRSEASPVAPSGSDKLFITVIADTWADIKDGTDFQLVYDLLRADQTLELTGTAPFSVFLGNGHGVEIRFNDEEIEFSSRIRDDNTARLKIGG
ncbi:MAG: helix-turn-helix domain-containing protein [Gammaproteobacteria bacterium]|nr:helix-turn-helix domain-containing protein [Gammaproteobacteria bacterium]